MCTISKEMKTVLCLPAVNTKSKEEGKRDIPSQTIMRIESYFPFNDNFISLVGV